MKAAQINAYGGPEVIEINEQAPRPSPDNGKLLIEIHAVSINPFDVKLKAGYMKDSIPLQFPMTVGGDYSGVVTAVGGDVSEFKAGDQVFGSASVLSGGSGSFAEFAVAKAITTAIKPAQASFEEAGALPLVGSSAVQALEEHMKLQNGQKILIHGGGGGIGHIAIQIAKHLGAYVATTVSEKDKDFVKQLGADEVIDYKSEHFEDKIKEFDAVYDTVGGETLHKSVQVLKKGGLLVSMLGKPDDGLISKYGIIAIAQGTKTNSTHLKRVAELVDDGKIKVHIDKTFPFDQVREAFKYQEQMHPSGKVVVKIK